MTHIPDRNPNPERIASLNDSFRQTFEGGRVMLTPSVHDSPYQDIILSAVKAYKFNGIDGNNPYGENDYGAFEIRGDRYMFKIDYFDSSYETASPDPTDTRVTRRVTTVLSLKSLLTGTHERYLFHSLH